MNKCIGFRKEKGVTNTLASCIRKKSSVTLEPHLVHNTTEAWSESDCFQCVDCETKHFGR